MTIISEKILNLRSSPTLAATNKAMEMKSKGIDVISLGVGEPDFDTPENIKEAAIRAIKDGKTKYTEVSGVKALRTAIAKKFQRDNNIEYQIDEISVASGAKQSIYNALIATLNPGEEVIIPSPYWVSYPDMVYIAGGKSIFVDCLEENNFLLTAQDLEKAITPETKWLILNSPSNPTGSAYSASQLKELAEVLRRNSQVYILSDDIYEHIIYDGFEFATLASVAPDLKDRILTVNGFSKSYSMTGWRLGYAAGNKQLIKAINNIQSQSTTHPCSIAQEAGIEALNGDQRFIEFSRDIFQKRRDLTLKLISEIPGLSANKPKGAFYFFINNKNFIGKKTQKGIDINDSDDFVNYLLEEAKVSAVSGKAFGMDGYFRISYAISEEIIIEAFSRIKSACSKL